MIDIKRSELKELAKKHFNSDSIENQNKIAVIIATAQAARVSYTIIGDNKVVSFENDITLHNKLLDSQHWSPFENCARVMTDDEYKSYWKSSANQRFKDKQDLIKVEGGWCRNFKGFIQYRELIS